MPEQKASRSDYVGCGLWALGFLVLVLVSFAVGVVLRPDAPPRVDAIGPDDVTLDDVGPRADGYRLVGGRDEVDDPCVILFRFREQVTGQCGVTRTEESDPDGGHYGVTSTVLENGRTAVFGPVPPGTARVVLDLADGTAPEVEVRRNDSADVTYFVHVTPVEVAGPATMLDRSGDVIPPP